MLILRDISIKQEAVNVFAIVLQISLTRLIINTQQKVVAHLNSNLGTTLGVKQSSDEKSPAPNGPLTLTLPEIS